MTPKQRKIGDTILITCPDCDGSGIKDSIITTDKEITVSDITQVCDTCKGLKQISGIVTKQ
jgi:DnaJ-class molecular chaperone